MSFQQLVVSRRLAVPTLVTQLTVTGSLLFIFILLVINGSDVGAKASSYVLGSTHNPHIVGDVFKSTAPDILEDVFNRTLGVSSLRTFTSLWGLRTNKR